MNPVFAWVAFGLAILDALLFLSALSVHLQIRRGELTATRSSRDNTLLAALVFLVITIAIAFIGIEVG